MTDPPVIYEYLDFRQFLGDLIAYKKARNRIFSHRFWARNCGFSSPNFIKLVVEDQRNLSTDSIAKIASGFSMDSQERDFFENMVLMNQASNHSEKDRYYRKMMATKEYSKIHKLDKDSYDYFSKWYYPAIREIVDFKDVGQSPDEISDQLTPKITAKEAEKALKLLENLGLIKRDESNRYIRCDKAVTTGSEVKSLVVGNYHREMIRLAGESLERFSQDERNITSLTLSISPQKIKEIIEKIADLRRDLLKIATSDEDASQVIQVNFQVFPLSKQI